MSMELDELIAYESGANFASCDIQTHLSLEMLGVDHDLVSNNRPYQSVDLVHESRTLEDYFYGCYSHSTRFHWFKSTSLSFIIFLTPCFCKSFNILYLVYHGDPMSLLSCVQFQSLYILVEAMFEVEWSPCKIRCQFLV